MAALWRVGVAARWRGGALHAPPNFLEKGACNVLLLLFLVIAVFFQFGQLVVELALSVRKLRRNHYLGAH